eukprot:gene26309-biopygen15747
MLGGSGGGEVVWGFATEHPTSTSRVGVDTPLLWT